jgi:hypothetical protein
MDGFCGAATQINGNHLIALFFGTVVEHWQGHVNSVKGSVISIASSNSHVKGEDFAQFCALPPDNRLQGRQVFSNRLASDCNVHVHAEIGALSGIRVHNGLSACTDTRRRCPKPRQRQRSEQWRPGAKARRGSAATETLNHR